MAGPFLSLAQRLFAGVARPFTRPAPPQPQSSNPPLTPDGFRLQHVTTFSGLVGGVARTYRWAFDEALRTSPENARAMRRDGWLIALLRERQMPSARSKWHLEPEDSRDARQVAAAGLLTDVIQRTPRFSRLRLKLLEALWYGKYGAQVALQRQGVKGRPAWVVSRYLPLHGDKIVYRWDGTPGVLVQGAAAAGYRDRGATVLTTDRGLALFLDNPGWRDRFLLHSHETDDADYTEPELAGGVQGVGLRHHAYWLWNLRSEVISWLLDYLARVGAGGLTVVWYDEGNPASKAAADQVAKDLETGNVILVPRNRGTDKQVNGVERIEPSQVGSSVLIDIVDRFFEQKIERLFVGQTMSSSTEGHGLGGTGVAELHADTKYQLIALDSEALDETLTTDLVAPLLRANVPGADFRLRFVSDLSKPDPAKVLEAVNTAYSMGVEFVEDEVRALTGLSAPQPGDKVLSQKQQQMDQAALGLGGVGPGGPGGGGNGDLGGGMGQRGPNAPDGSDGSDGGGGPGQPKGQVGGAKALNRPKPPGTPPQPPPAPKPDGGDKPQRYARWDESQHPRGQPENAGEFGPGGGGESEPRGGIRRPMTPEHGNAVGAKLHARVSKLAEKNAGKAPAADVRRHVLTAGRQLRDSIRHWHEDATAGLREEYGGWLDTPAAAALLKTFGEGVDAELSDAAAFANAAGSAFTRDPGRHPVTGGAGERGRVKDTLHKAGDSIHRNLTAVLEQYKAEAESLYDTAQDVLSEAEETQGDEGIDEEAFAEIEDDLTERIEPTGWRLVRANGRYWDIEPDVPAPAP